MNSMTGFGSADFLTAAGVEIHIDIASYNKKQLDIRVSLPNELASHETDLRKTISSRVSRGTLNLKLEVYSSGVNSNSVFEIDKKLASAYVKSAKKLQNRLQLSGEIDVNEVLKVPGIIQETQPINLVSDKDLDITLNIALDKLLKMRKEEGSELKKDVESRLKTLTELLEKIEPLTRTIPEIQKDRLLKNLKNAGLSITIDDERVLKEIVIFTDRSDVSEEITRINSHFVQFRKLIRSKEPVGRSMEFLIQELQREINTLGTKAANSEISPLIVKFKTELEKIREQVQNVE
jgi:uncharacterized protein (TIGR00255 family)